MWGSWLSYLLFSNTARFCVCNRVQGAPHRSTCSLWMCRWRTARGKMMQWCTNRRSKTPKYHKTRQPKAKAQISHFCPVNASVLNITRESNSFPDGWAWQIFPSPLSGTCHCKKRAHLPLWPHDCSASSVATIKHCLWVGELNILLSLTALIFSFPAILCKGHTLHGPYSASAASFRMCIPSSSHPQALLGGCCWEPQDPPPSTPLQGVQQGKRVGKANPGATFRARMQNWRTPPPPAGKGSRRSKCWRRLPGPGCERQKSVATGCLLTYSSALKTR